MEGIATNWPTKFLLVLSEKLKIDWEKLYFLRGKLKNTQGIFALAQHGFILNCQLEQQINLTRSKKI